MLSLTDRLDWQARILMIEFHRSFAIISVGKVFVVRYVLYVFVLH